MQKKIVKMTLIVLIIFLAILTGKVYATNDTVNSSSDISIGEDAEEEEEEVVDTGSTLADRENEEGQDTIKPTSTYTPKISQPTTSYSTTATIPEANLTLNNILNVILIAVGVILILLAIAILIRLK